MGGVLTIKANKKDITLGSLFDGIGGFPYAASFYGIKTLWASEIVPAAISVTRRHFPDIEHLGDITKLNGGEITPVEIITFGSPCQSFSIAGQRLGLEGKSGLFWEAVRIIREMRGATNGKYPKYSVFENVPGILSANGGRDYQTVLEAFTETEIPLPPSGRWTNAGMVRGGRIDCAWVIHDAQHFGVAQRRRRLFAVCDFTGQRAAEILFKPKSLHRHFTQGGETGKNIAPNAAGSVRGASRSASVKDIASTLVAGYGNHWNGNAGAYDGSNFALTTVLNDQGGNSLTIEKKEISPTLRSETHGNLPIVSMRVDMNQNKKFHIFSLDSAESNSMKSKNANSGCRETETAKTIDTTNPCPSKNQGGIAIVCARSENEKCAYGFDLQQITSKTNRSQLKEIQPVLCKAGRPHICILQNPTAKESDNGTAKFIVRRLTPVECERLQGFPDGWAEYGHDGKPLSDTARYQALGNAVCVNVAAYVLSGIVDEFNCMSKYREVS